MRGVRGEREGKSCCLLLQPEDLVCGLESWLGVDLRRVYIYRYSVCHGLLLWGGMYVYYWRTWYKAVCGGKGGSEGHVLRDTASRGLRGRV